MKQKPLCSQRGCTRRSIVSWTLRIRDTSANELTTFRIYACGEHRAALHRARKKVLWTAKSKGATGAGGDGMIGPEDDPYDECETCKSTRFVKTCQGKVIPCPRCNPDGAPYGEAECDNF